MIIAQIKDEHQLSLQCMQSCVWCSERASLTELLGIASIFRREAGCNVSRSTPDEVLQGLVHRAVRHDLVDSVAGPAQREAEVVCHAQQLSKVDTCIALDCQSFAEN